MKNNLEKTFVSLDALKCVLHGYSSFSELTAAWDTLQWALQCGTLHAKLL